MAVTGIVVYDSETFRAACSDKAIYQRVNQFDGRSRAAEAANHDRRAILNIGNCLRKRGNSFVHGALPHYGHQIHSLTQQM